MSHSLRIAIVSGIMLLNGCTSYDEIQRFDNVTVGELAGDPYIHAEGSDDLEKLYLVLPNESVKQAASISPADVEPFFLKQLIQRGDNGVVIYGQVNSMCVFIFQGDKLEAMRLGAFTRYGIGRSASGPFLFTPLKSLRDPQIGAVFGRPREVKYFPKPNL